MPRRRHMGGRGYHWRRGSVAAPMGGASRSSPTRCRHTGTAAGATAAWQVNLQRQRRRRRASAPPPPPLAPPTAGSVSPPQSVLTLAASAQQRHPRSQPALLAGAISRRRHSLASPPQPTSSQLTAPAGVAPCALRRTNRRLRPVLRFPASGIPSEWRRLRWWDDDVPRPLQPTGMHRWQGEHVDGGNGSCVERAVWRGVTMTCPGAPFITPPPRRRADAPTR